MENGADVNIGFEGLRFTASYGNLECLKMVVDAGLSNYNIQRALASAAAGSNYSAMVFLVEHGANANGFGEPLESCKESHSLPHEELQTPLVFCAATPVLGLGYEKSLKCFQYLIEAGASLDRVCAPAWGNGDVLNGPQTTALHTAAYYGRLDIVRSLLERGVDVNLSLGEQHTALSSALSSEGHHEIRTRMYEDFDPASFLRVPATIRQLIDLGADPQLCKDVEIRRIETLLNMSSDNCRTLATLQTLASCLLHFEQKSVRDKISELKELIAEGANLDLCCDRDKKKIGIFLAWSEEEIEVFDKERKRGLARRVEWEIRRPI